MRLLDEYAPEVLVLKSPQTETSKEIVQVIRTQAKVQRIPMRVLSPRVQQETFAGRNGNKHQVASAIAERFPELLYILPPKRRPWQSEDYRTSIFDAGALGIAYFAQKSREDPVMPTR
jgi:hypothetical protein